MLRRRNVVEVGGSYANISYCSLKDEICTILNIHKLKELRPSLLISSNSQLFFLQKNTLNCLMIFN